LYNEGGGNASHPCRLNNGFLVTPCRLSPGES